MTKNFYDISFICSLTSIALTILFFNFVHTFFFITAPILGILGAVLGFIAYGDKKKKKWKAVFAIIWGIVMTLLLIYFFWWYNYLNTY